MSLNDSGLIDRWEYHVEYVEGRPHHNHGRPDLNPRFDTLGSDGWELVSLALFEQRGDNTTWMGVFKRLRLQSPEEQAPPPTEQRPHRFSSF